MAFCTTAAAKVIGLLTISYDKQQRTSNIQNNPPIAYFQRHLLLQTMITPQLHCSHVYQNHVHDPVNNVCVVVALHQRVGP